MKLPCDPVTLIKVFGEDEVFFAITNGLRSHINSVNVSVYGARALSSLCGTLPENEAKAEADKFERAFDVYSECVSKIHIQNQVKLKST